ncbi:chromosome partitioning protein ParB [Burkholderia cepacia]|uniref:ParB/RepB/Spo0J family partition protein n=1 Tax=Burkholderia cepacia TaxID=292 RepID=UPI000756B4E4|nr:ParB/RepB/Spo0J family partition protein [Burkholderia cepacia]KUY84962.1 chromosome partitioning protein ParB [Burkholderia cepacia]
MSAFGSKISKLSEIQKQGAAAALPGERIIEIDPNLVDFEKQIRSKDNPGFTKESLTELGNDMKRDGQHEPVVVRKNPKKAGRYLMVAGERRCRGCQIAGIRLKAVVRDMTDEQARRVQRAENIQRENLTQLEIAVALRDDKVRLGTLEKVAAEWNKGINWVAERIKFLEVVETGGLASAAVASGVTADITAVNDLHRLEKADPASASAVIEEATADPSTNVRKAVRDKLRDAKPGKGVSRTRETQPPKSKQSKLAADTADLVANAAAQAQALCDQVNALSMLLQEHRDVFGSLADATQSVVNAQVELSRTRHALAALTKSE